MSFDFQGGKHVLMKRKKNKLLIIIIYNFVGNGS